MEYIYHQNSLFHNIPRAVSDSSLQKNIKQHLMSLLEGYLLTVNNQWKKTKPLHLCIKRIVWLVFPVINETSKLGCS